MPADPSRTPSPSGHRRQRLSAGGRGQRRRLPATPNQPSTLNIDSLTNVASNSSGDVRANNIAESAGNLARNFLSINFPKLNPSPSRNAVNNKPIKRTVAGARLPEVPKEAKAIRRSLPNRGGPWSRSLDDQATFEEVVRAGRGTRQLPAVGPQQLASANARGRGTVRRELPRPGTSIGFSPSTLYLGNSLDRSFHHTIGTYSSNQQFSDSDEEDWC